jgi:hypothetical protein
MAFSPGYPAQQTVLGCSTALRNIPAALVVSVQNFKELNVSMMVIVTTLIGTLLLVPAVRLIGKREPSSLSGEKAIDSN